jgi:hypothetical protein
MYFLVNPSFVVTGMSRVGQQKEQKLETQVLQSFWEVVENPSSHGLRQAAMIHPGHCQK